MIQDDASREWMGIDQRLWRASMNDNLCLDRRNQILGSFAVFVDATPRVEDVFFWAGKKERSTGVFLHQIGILWNESMQIGPKIYPRSQPIEVSVRSQLQGRGKWRKGFGYRKAKKSHKPRQ